jgi:hypothetical protein
MSGTAITSSLLAVLAFSTIASAADTRMAAAAACTAAPGRPDIRVRLVSFTELVRLETAPMIQEIDRIWAQHGVQLSWDVATPGPQLRALNDVDLWVHLLDTREYRSPTRSGPPILGTVRFSQGQPLELIRVSVAAAVELLRHHFLRGNDTFHVQLPVHTRILQRVLARTIAHEIGHVVLRTSEHSDKGLMRARISAPDLMADEEAGFALERRHARRLDRYLTASRADCVSIVAAR